MMTIVQRIQRRKVKPLGSNASNRGFTIIEALISIILFTITLTGGLAIYINADRIVTLTSHKRMAVEMANLRMEQIRVMGYTVFGATFSVTDPSFIETFDDVIIPPPIGGFTVDREITVEHFPLQAVPEYKKVTVGIEWTEADSIEPRTVEITSIIVP